MSEITSPSDTRVLLVRHGQIQANIDKKWHGWTDSGLTATGKEQAHRAGLRLKHQHPDISAVYSSPLERTRHTAKAIGDAFDMSVQVIDGLKEYGIGVWEGKSFEDLKQQHNFFEQIKQDRHFAPTDGESIHQVSERVVNSIAQLAANHQGETIVAVSHGAAMALLLANLLHQDPYEWNRYQFANTGVTELLIGTNATLKGFNCVSHLEDLK